MEKRMKLQIIVTALFCILLLGNCCEEPISPEENKSILLTYIDASLNEIYLQLNVEGLDGSEKIFISRDGETIMQYEAKNTEIFITDTVLAEGTSHNYKALLVSNGIVEKETESVLAKTLLPTSHDFTWEVYEIADASSGSFNDVTVVNDSNIWVVGEYYIPDSNGINETYGFVRIINNNIEYIRLFAKAPDGHSMLLRPKSIFPIEETALWLLTGSAVFKYDYKNIVTYLLYPSLLNDQQLLLSLWGTSNSNIYAIGTAGTLIHFDGTRWSRIELGLTQDLCGLYGYKNPATDNITVYYTEIFANKFYKLKNNTELELETLPDGMFLGSIWTNDGHHFYITTNDGIYTNIKNGWEKVGPEVLYGAGMRHISGNGLNDLFSINVLGVACHYDGKEWKEYDEFKNKDYWFHRVSFNKNTVAIIGENNSKLILIIGRRK